MKTIVLCIFLSLALAFAASAADVNGKWNGSFTAETGDAGSAYLVLSQSGSAVTGSGGPDEGNQWPGLKGTIDGNNFAFEVKSAEDGTVYKATLVLDGDHLKGDVAFTTPDGQTMKAKLDLTRVK